MALFPSNIEAICDFVQNITGFVSRHERSMCVEFRRVVDKVGIDTNAERVARAFDTKKKPSMQELEQQRLTKLHYIVQALKKLRDEWKYENIDTFVEFKQLNPTADQEQIDILYGFEVGWALLFSSRLPCERDLSFTINMFRKAILHLCLWSIATQNNINVINKYNVRQIKTAFEFGHHLQRAYTLYATHPLGDSLSTPTGSFWVTQTRFNDRVCEDPNREYDPDNVKQNWFTVTASHEKLCKFFKVDLCAVAPFWYINLYSRSCASDIRADIRASDITVWDE